MNIDDWLDSFAAGRMSKDDLKKKLLAETFADIGVARLDTHRPQRSGVPEAIYCAGKTPEQVARIYSHLAEKGLAILGTRARQEHYVAAREVAPDVLFDPISRLLTLPAASPDHAPAAESVGCVMVVCAGTSDLPVMEEAAQTAEFLGSRVVRHTDCGAAGLHRLIACAPDMVAARCIIAVAGMDGVLPTVVSGLCACPVVAVPTSVGYGAGLGGVAALLTMLNSCAPGLSVVNIDNGFGAGYLAHVINRQSCAPNQTSQIAKDSE